MPILRTYTWNRSKQSSLFHYYNNMKKFWNKFIDDFLMEKSVNQWISDRMVEIYLTVFRCADSSKHLNLTDLSTYTTKNFKMFLWESFLEKNWASKTYNFYRRYLRAYCRFLVDEWYLHENPIDKILKRKEPKTLPKTLSKEQVKKLLDVLPHTFNPDSFLWVRNKTMVYTYLYTWMRLSELTNLKIENLKLHDWLIQVIWWKWSKDRLIPLSQELTKPLFNYLKVRRQAMIDSDYVFPSLYWKSLRKGDMRTVLMRIRKYTAFNFTWHQLRHTYATELVRNNFDIYNISQILGHSTIDTTKIYLSVDTDKLKKQIDSINLFS